MLRIVRKNCKKAVW